MEGLALVVHGCSPLRGWLGREESVRGSREGMTGKDGLGEGKKLRGRLTDCSLSTKLTPTTENRGHLPPIAATINNELKREPPAA